MTRQTVITIFLFLVAIGYYCGTQLPIKLKPTPHSKELSISLNWPMIPSEIIEKKITTILESKFSTLDFIKEIKSKTSLGKSTIYLKFDDDNFLDRNLYTVRTVIQQTYEDFPNGVTYPQSKLTNSNKNKSVLIEYSLFDKSKSIDLESFYDDVIYPELSKLKGIESIKLYGRKDRALQIIYDPSMLEKHQITRNDIETKIVQKLSHEHLGLLISNHKELTVRYKAEDVLSELKQLSLKSADGRKSINLSNLVEFKLQEKPRQENFRINGNRTVNFIIYAQENANELEVASAVKNKISSLEENSKAAFLITHDNSIQIKKELFEISTRTGISLAVLFLTVLFFYRNVKDIAILFAALFVTLGCVASLYLIFGVEVHMYSLLGLTISLGFMIDNYVIAINHYKKSRDKKIILPILAATLTTICPLLIIFSLDQEAQNNLNDFVLIIILNLLVSLLITAWLLPYLISSQTKPKAHNKKQTAPFAKYFHKTIAILYRLKYLLLISIIFCLGIPINQLPEKIDATNDLSSWYNSIIKSQKYKHTIEPWMQKYAGGVLQQFIDNSINSNFISEQERPRLIVGITTPDGATYDYIDDLCRTVESQLSNIDYLESYQTNIDNNKNAEIKILFDQNKEDTDLPFRVKGFLESIAIKTGGATFYVLGAGDPFSNSTGHFVTANLIISGYNYDVLFQLAEKIKTSASEISFVNKVEIKSQPSWKFNSSKEHVARFLREDIDQNKVFQSLNNSFSKNHLGKYTIDSKLVNIELQPKSYDSSNKYSVQRKLLKIDSSNYIKSLYAFELAQKELPNSIIKANQQYQLAIQLEISGTEKAKLFVVDNLLEQYQSNLPLGYKLYNFNHSNGFKTKTGLVISIISSFFLVYILCVIFFESFKLSFATVLLVPYTFVGVLYILSAFKIGFNQGVYIGLILLSGLLINSAIFIIDEYKTHIKSRSSISAFIEAYRNKITPIIITSFTTIASLTPYLWFSSNSFWFSFSLTVISGLLLSILVLTFILPVFVIKN